MSDIPPDKLTPYKGLMPYAEQDAPFFFGRERERAIITANLMAARLTVLYGPSGAGKSSVLRAGVEHTLREYVHRNLKEHGEPELAVVVFNNWRDDPVAGLSRAVEETLKQTLTALGQADDSPPMPHDLLQNLEAWAQRLNGELLIILDQFEEYFLYHAQEDGEGTFAVEFPRAVNSTGLRVNFLVALREDALSKLDRFKGRIPNLFDNYLRIAHLTQEAARDAIVKPLEEYNRRQTNEAERVTIEAALVEAVLAQVQTGRVTLARDGSGSVGDGQQPAEATIETSYLQLVRTRLWDEEMQAGSRTLRLMTLDRLKGAEHIVRTHLDSVMVGLSPDERDSAADVFRYLVTPSGTKIAYTVKDLVAYTNTSSAQLTPVLERLAGSGLRILRTVDPPPDQPREIRYEIFHDVLASAILDWRTRYMQEKDARKLAAELEAKASRRLRRLAIALVVVSLVAIVAAIVAWNTVQVNADQQQLSRSRELASRALREGNGNPELGLLIAIEAEKVADTYEVHDAMQQLLKASGALGVGGVLRGHESPVNSAQFSPDGKSIVTASDDHTARVWDVATGKEITVLSGHEGAVFSARFSPDGKQIVTAGDDQTARVWDVATGKEITVLRHDDSLLGARFSPDGKQIVTTSRDKNARVWDAATGQELATLRGHADWVIRAQFSPDGKSIVTASLDKTARVWDAATGTELAVLRGHEGKVESVQFSPDGKQIVTASDDGTARVWDAATGTELAVLRGHQTTVYFSEFSPDGKYVVTASQDRTARVWEAATGRQMAVLRGHEGYVSIALFSPNGKEIVTAGEDGTARVWDLATGKEIIVLHEGPVESAQFSPDGKYIVTVGRDWIARIDVVHIEDLVALAKTRVTRELTCQERLFYLPEDMICPTPTP